ncbi:MAG: suppressor of fused domain protein [Clostridium sp.]|nr:suppressor of fused domain protein [Muribaculum sp.]MCM1227863.1 suppressor of fused domain protein [Clostridium sp.]
MNLEETVFKEAYRAFNGEYKVFEYLDEKEKKAIDILSCFDTPYENVNSYATLGLCNIDARLESGGKPLLAELVSACESKYDFFPNIMSTSAFQIIDGIISYAPGVVVPNVVSMYYSDRKMKHMLMAYPFLWEHELYTISAENKLISWLQLIPISDLEYEYLLKYGYNALEDAFEQNEIDVVDLNRNCIFS